MPVIGVSIAIPPPYAAELQTARASYGDPLAGSIPTHVTLLPPTEVDDDDLDLVTEHLAEVAKVHQPFRMTLQGTDTFRPVSPVVFVQVVGGRTEVEQLELDIRSGMLRRELAFAFHPHVTVAHDVPQDALDRALEELGSYRCDFEVTDFHLYEHGDDGVWRPVRSFGLNGASTATGIGGMP